MQIKYGYTIDTVLKLRNSVEELRQGRRRKRAVGVLKPRKDYKLLNE